MLEKRPNLLLGAGEGATGDHWTRKPPKEPVVVGIAASAGGLEAMSLFLKNLPKGLNCSFVLAQHISPSHEGMLVKLLSRETTPEVREIREPTQPKADTVYIPPPPAAMSDSPRAGCGC